MCIGKRKIKNAITKKKNTEHNPSAYADMHFKTNNLECSTMTLFKIFCLNSKYERITKKKRSYLGLV